MDLGNWPYAKAYLEDYPKNIFNNNNTILANSVIACNYELLKKIQDHDKILEIGCGNTMAKRKYQYKRKLERFRCI